MAATWAITNLQYYLEKDGHQNVVRRVDFTCTQNDVGSGMSTQIESFILPPIDNLSNFTEYQNLTEEQIISWVKDQLTDHTVSVMEQELLDELNRKVSLGATASGLPWAS